MLRKFFSKRTGKENDDVVVYARTIEKRIDEASLDIFREYKRILLKESNIYIVAAVWGAIKDGDLTTEQKEIHARISPVIREALGLLLQNSSNAQQNFAIGYLVRALFISKIIYMAEFYKNLSGNQAHSADDMDMDHQKNNLKDIEPLGHA